MKLRYLAFLWPALMLSQARAESSTWGFDSATDYTVSDSSAIAVGEGLAALNLTSLYGTGADGVLNVSSGTTTLNPARATLTATAGSTSLTVSSSSGFAAGQTLLLHQTQGSGAGAWEEVEVVAVASSTSLTVKRPLQNSYSSASGNNHAQAMQIFQYASITVASGGVLTGPAWNGTTGGILAFKVKGLLDVQSGGRIHMNALGYRGTSHTGIYRNQNGWQGESYPGPGAQQSSNTAPCNASGGCGGFQRIGNNGTGGGGGGHGSAGAASVVNVYGVPAVQGGAAVGSPSLGSIYFGGAGGEGSADEDGYAPGPGGAGGGIVYALASSTKLVGVITADGAAGGPGVQSCSGCGGGGMSGGGGGAGGSVFLRTTAATLGANTLTAAGGAPGAGTESNPGGAGGVGRIRVDFLTINGIAYGVTGADTQLAADTNPDAYAAKGLLGAYASNSPSLWNAIALSPAALGNYTGFSATVTASTAGQVGFQLSVDGGSSFLYWNGASWAPATSIDQVSPATTLNAHMDTLPPGPLVWKAYLTSDGTQAVELDSVTVSWANDPFKVDDDGDGFSEAAGDCDDTSSVVSPDATEVCNLIDDDCDELVDEDVTLPFYADLDGDGFGDILEPIQACEAPADFVEDATDCDDSMATVYPGADEVCNEVDDDCDGAADDGVQSVFYLDADSDGYGDADQMILACSLPEGYAFELTDCNDQVSSTHPGASEVCDGVDQDCDGDIDEGVKDTFYADSDGDGFGNATSPTLACTQPSGYVTDQTDCNDGVSSTYPGAGEVCDGVDQDCDGQVDEGVKLTFYADGDGDGYGNSSSPTLACEAPNGYVSDSTDCDDTVASVYPSSEEVPYDGIDQDCQGGDLVDVDQDGYTASEVGGDDCNDQVSSIHPGVEELFNGIDDDCDGVIDEGTPGADADQDGWTPATGDCDDSRADVHPEALEVCDGTDQDCDGRIDEGTACYDDDEDGYSEDGSVGGKSDCDDADATVFPGATEIADGKDNDCNGLIDDKLDTFDDDADGYAESQGDCNDANPKVNPGMAEKCDGVDEDCDGVVDQGTPCHDDDGDGYSEDEGDCDDADPGRRPLALEGTPGGAFGALAGDGVDNNCNEVIDEGTDAYDDDGDGYTELDGDCQDDAEAVYPEAEERCDGVDQDCNGVIDEGTECYDDDGDGFSEDGSVGGAQDCLDSDAAISPAAEGDPQDGVDNDCDGLIDEDLETPEVTPTQAPEETPTETPQVTPTETPDPTSPPGNTSGGGCGCSTETRTPSALSILGLGLAGLLMARRRRAA